MRGATASKVQFLAPPLQKGSTVNILKHRNVILCVYYIDVSSDICVIFYYREHRRQQSWDQQSR